MQWLQVVSKALEGAGTCITCSAQESSMQPTNQHTVSDFNLRFSEMWSDGITKQVNPYSDDWMWIRHLWAPACWWADYFTTMKKLSCYGFTLSSEWPIIGEIPNPSIDTDCRNVSTVKKHPFCLFFPLSLSLSVCLSVCLSLSLSLFLANNNSSLSRANSFLQAGSSVNIGLF